jgi:hypothetical protein
MGKGKKSFASGYTSWNSHPCSCKLFFLLMKKGQPPHPGMVKLCTMKQFKDAILDDMNRIGQADKLRGFEYVKMIHLEPVFFSVENSMLTPTFKLKRNEAAEYYRPVINDMYKRLNDSKPAPKL